MSEVDSAQARGLFFTGTSAFLEANEFFVRSMIHASSQCAIHASEDIFDSNGLKLWARGKPIAEHLLERLLNRQLRKPIEVCVYAADPIAKAGLADAVQEAISVNDAVRAALEPHLDRILSPIRAIVPNPTELMLLSVMRYGERNMMQHAGLVAAIAMSMAVLGGAQGEVLRSLARAALLHDVGELYLPPELFSARDTPLNVEQILRMRNHPLLGAQVAVQLARIPATVGHLIALSHERLDGWGYPRGVTADELSLPARALFFAEAMAHLIAAPTGMHRAAVAAHLVPGEFAPEMVNWMVRCARGTPFAPMSAELAESVELDLSQIHSALTGARLLLDRPVAHETAKVRAAADQWRSALEALMRPLRMSGVTAALSIGMAVQAQSDCELVELSELSRELRYRVRTLSLRLQLAAKQEPEFGQSSLVLDLIEALNACQPVPSLAESSDAADVAVMPWSPLYSVGVQAIDDQHRVLVGLLNKLGAARRQGADAGVVDEVLVGLVAYVQEHFSFEERLMREQNYPDVEAHTAAHGRLASRVAQMVQRHRQGGAPVLDELVLFLRQWLIAHILHTDLALGRSLNAHGIQ